MTPADIIRMAREAWGDLACSMQDEPIQFFANKVAAAAEAAEREACAKVCESAVWGADIDEWRSMTKRDVSARSMHECAAAIRARSQQPEKHTPCAGKLTNNPPSPGAWEFYQPCHHCLRRLAQGSQPRPAPPEFIDGECPSRIGAAP